VVGSRTPPVEEVIRDGENGLLVDFFNPQALAETIASVLADRAGHSPLAIQARRTVVEHFDRDAVCLPKQLALVDALG
jgi:glycosyltransferase involved in cell wall biosynthesis